MPSAKLKSLPVDYRSISLTPEEGFVLSRIGAHCSVHELAALTGLQPERVESIVEHLVHEGAVAIDEDAPQGGSGEREPNSDAVGANSAAESRLPLEADTQVETRLPDDHEQPDQVLDEESAAQDGVNRSPTDERNSRKLYHERFASMSASQRSSHAKLARGFELSALCLDPDPEVVAALLENTSFALAEARQVARYHQNPRGLELLAKRAAFLLDAQVKQRLLRNSQLPESLLRRILQSKRLTDLHRWCIDRELPERSRSMVRRELRARFQSASSEEKADLVHRTEGRVLLLLTGCTFDGRMTAIMCGKSYRSVLLVQNLARFSATPPPLLARLLGQSIVQRNQHLKRLLLMHPNTPSQAKRSRGGR